MNSRRPSLAHWLAHTALVLGLLATAPARERGPRVEVVCPFPPTPARINDKQVLVYELHVTNFDTVPLVLQQVEVFADNEKGAPITTLRDANLSGAMMRVGAGMDAMAAGGRKDVQTIQPGARSVVFMWIELHSDAAKPSSLRHRMVFAPAEAEGATKEAILEDFPVVVSQDTAPVLSPPFRGGTWAAAGVGNGSAHRRTITAIDGQIYSAERFAIDWVKVGPNGDSHDGTARNENWWGYSEPVLAVADGEVTAVLDGIPDNTPRVLPEKVTLDNIAGNYVTVRIGTDRYTTFAHLQNGSIKVKPHQQVHRGDVVGLLGNSGNTTGPHLHFQLTDRDAVLKAEGLPFIFERFIYLGPGTEYEADKHPSVPWRDSIPPDMAVVEFK